MEFKNFEVSHPLVDIKSDVYKECVNFLEQEQEKLIAKLMIPESYYRFVNTYADPNPIGKRKLKDRFYIKFD